MGLYVSDVVHNMNGGLKKGTVIMGKMDMGLNLDFEKAKLWRGGTFTLIGQSTHGGRASEKYIGDMQILSSIEHADYTYLSECYYK